VSDKTPTEKALAEAIDEHITRVAWCGCQLWRDDEIVPIVNAARADERARLAASVPPMTMTAEEFSRMTRWLGASRDMGYREALAEINALCAALAAAQEKLSESEGR